MGCASSKLASVAPASSAVPHSPDRVTSPTLPEDSGAPPVPSAGTPAATTAGTRCEAPSAFDRVMEAKDKEDYIAGAAETAVNTAHSILSAAPPGIVDSLATGAAGAAASAVEFTATNAPGLASFLGSLCGAAADLLGAVAPAIPFGGVAVAVVGKALEQGQAYAQAIVAAQDLRQAIADRRSTIELFAGEASLVQAHAPLVRHAAQTLRDAVALLAKSYDGKTRLRSEVFKFFTARGGLQALQDASSGLKVRAMMEQIAVYPNNARSSRDGNRGFSKQADPSSYLMTLFPSSSPQELTNAIGDAAAVSAAVNTRQLVVVQQAEAERARRKDDIERAKDVRAAVTHHLAIRAAVTGRGLLPVYGLTLGELAGAPPAAVTLWVVESTAESAEGGAGGGTSKGKTMLASGSEAMKSLLEPRAIGTPGACVVIGAVRCWWGTNRCKT